MRNELNIIEHIEKYLRDELSVTDKKAFEDKLKTDVKLQREVELQKDVIKGIERIGVRQSIQKSYKNYRGRQRWFFMGLILLVITIGGVGINYLNNSSDNSVVNNKKNTEVVGNINNEPVVIAEKESIANYELVDSELETKDSIQEIRKRLVSNRVVKQEKSEIIRFPEKQFQYFTINSSKDEKIVGKEGTKIIFKANSFNVKKNSLIKIRLKEYYKMEDIIFSDLTTETVDGKLLETGGMIYLDALVDNRKVSLNQNTFFDIKFPFDKKKEGMILFDGKVKTEKIIWKESEIGKRTIEQVTAFDYLTESQRLGVFTIVEQMPEFKGGQKALYEYLGKNIKYPLNAKKRNISGKVYVNFIVDKKGRVSNVKVLRGIDASLDNEAIRVIMSMPRWKPGKQRGEAVAVSYNLPIVFKLDGSTTVYSAEQIKYFSDSLQKARKSDIEEDVFGNEDTLSKDVFAHHRIQDKISYYALSGSQLGWINCDRFAGRGNITYTLKVGSGRVNVKLIFHRIKSLMVGRNNGSYSMFSRIPSGEKVTVFAIKYIDKKPFVCLLGIKTSNKVVQLEFEELTKTKLEEITNRISEI